MLESHRSALEIDQDIGNPLGEANVLSNIGLNYEMRRRLAETLEHRQRARDVGAAIDPPIAEENTEPVQARIEASR